MENRIQTGYVSRIMSQKEHEPEPLPTGVRGEDEVEAIERELAKLRERFEAEEVPERLLELGRRLQWLADRRAKRRE